MPPTTRARRFLLRALLFGLAGYLVGRLGRPGPEPAPLAPVAELPEPVEAPAAGPAPFRSPARRVATTLAFSVLFFAGAAFTAGAGNDLAALMDSRSAPDKAAPAATTTETVDSGRQPVDPADPVDPAPQPTDPAPPESTDPAPPAPTDPAPPESTDPAPPADTVPASTDPVATTVPSDPAPAPAATETTPAPASDDAPPRKIEPATVPVAADSSPKASAPSPSTSKPKRAPAASRSTKAAAVKAPKAARPDKVREPARKKDAPPLEPEATDPNVAATVWLNSAPDPLPPSLPLSPGFARDLKHTAARAGADWALVLAVLRVQGDDTAVPAPADQVASLSQQLSGLRDHTDRLAGVLEALGRGDQADAALALARYYHVAGLNGLVRGLDSQRWTLVQTLLDDRRVTIYDGGRGDVAAGRVDVRVLAAVEYLADTFGEVTVSCLITGHRLYARPGVISAHIYGRAVDVASVGGIPILGNQEPGGITEQAIKQILLLPPEMMPRQVISLLGLGGPSFPLADHYNHIHLGW